jgi:hypothetical protein
VLYGVGLLSLDSPLGENSAPVISSRQWNFGLCVLWIYIMLYSQYALSLQFYYRYRSLVK